jgi:cell division protein FtsI (penicillin-binding protein 3)
MTNYKIKSAFVFFIFLCAYSVILVKLYFVQVVKSDFFKNLAVKQYKIYVTQQPSRGLIFDRNDKPLVINRDSISAFIMPHKIINKKELEFFLKKNFPQAYDRLINSEHKYFIYIKRNLSDSEIDLIESSKIEDIKFIKEPNRFYPYKNLGVITGVTDIDNKGLFGMELQFNKLLSGVETRYIVEKDARSKNFYFKKDIDKEGISGKNIKLTIDADLQFLVHQELKEVVKKFKAKDGAVVIMDPDTGHILSMANYPDFNPNKISELDLDRAKNKCITESYELGSVMKVFVALAAIEEGVVTKEEEIDCENKKETYINGMKFSTVHIDGKIPFFRVIEVSNNIGMVKVATRLSVKLYDHYKRFGFTKKTGIFAGEQSGFITPVNQWSKRSIISLAFGYEITANLVQLAKAFSIIANGGYDVEPQLIYDSQGDIKKHKLYSDRAIFEIKEMLRGTVEKGTARKALVKGYNIMGKTGTANTVVDGQYSYDHNVYTFTGLVEKGNYKRVIVTFIKDSVLKNVYASTVAAPLFNKVAEKMLIHDRVLN